MQLKSDLYKRPLLHKRVDAKTIVRVNKDPNAFQGHKIVKVADLEFPYILNSKEPVIFDFGDHYTGYLNMEFDNCKETPHIADSPTNIVFEFSEMPIEIDERPIDNPQCLSVSWMQDDYKTMALLPYKGSLDRRVSFRYLKIKRVDPVRFPVQINALYVDAVSAVDLDSVPPLNSDDELLNKIDRICLKTLKECEQDVFEDGPKRDRRLWIGDLRLQALLDYKTFKNIDLVKRCICLFADHLQTDGKVAPCVFPDSPPYVDNWYFMDYSLCFVSCLYDFMKNIGEREFAQQFYDIAAFQIKFADEHFNRETKTLDAPVFIDHTPFDKSIALLCYFAYTLNHMVELSKTLNKEYKSYEKILSEVKEAILTYYCEKEGFFVTAKGEISWHSQVWAVLAGVLSKEESAELLRRTAKEDPELKFSSPFIHHYYIEALYSCGMDKEALEHIKLYWGAMLKAGFDCCPECLMLNNEYWTGYGHPSLNSACHAWSCTASYWLR